MMSKPQFHVGIVGAGLGGLAAAIGVARAGHKVTILEQSSTVNEVRNNLTWFVFLFYSNFEPGWSGHPNSAQFITNPQAMEAAR
jgi:cation diffusion facilitator CzcD-associated flavoprotein CzcO